MREKNELLDETTWRIIREAKGIAGWVAVSAVLGILAVLCSIAAPEILGNLIQKLYDFGLSDRQTPIRDSLVSGLLLLTAVYAAQGVFRYLNMQLMNRTVSRHFTCDLRIAISDKIRRLPVKYVDQTPVGDVLNRMIDDVSAMGNYIHQVFDVMVEGVFQITMIAVAMFLKNWVLACLVIVLTPISLWISSKIAGASGKYYDEWFKKSGELTEIVEESFTNFATAKAYNLEEYTAQKHAVVNEQLRKAVSKANFTGSIVQPLIKFGNAMAYICINLIGGWLIVRRGVGVGTVVTIVLFARQFASPLEQIASGSANLTHVKASAKRVFRIMDMEEEEQPEGTLPEPCRGEVVFDKAAFSYTKDEPLIENLNLSVHPGQRVAIVGPTGAGKTTIVNLLMRFYDVDGGKILLDGQDIKSLSRDEVRRNFGMVLQDTWLFRGTIAENVAYGKPDATREEIELACREGVLRPLYPHHARRLRHPDQRGHHQPFRRAEAAADHRPCAAGKSSAADSGRGHLQRGHPDGNTGAEGHGQADEGENLLRHRPPAQHHRGRRPHSGAESRPHCGAGDSRSAAGEKGLLLRPLHQPVRGIRRRNAVSCAEPFPAAF